MDPFGLEKSDFFEKVVSSSNQITHESNDDASSFVTNKQLGKKHDILRAEIQSLREELQNFERKKRPENKEKYFKNLKKIFISWSERSDVNCYVKIFEYENIFVKLLWLIILLVSLSVTLWIMSLSVIEYFEYNVISQIGVVFEQPTEFPAVTICDNAPFTTQQGLDFVNSLTNNSDCLIWDGGDLMSCLILLALDIASEYSYGDDERKQLGLNINQISCFYNGNDCIKDLHWYWNHDYGSCFQFNVGLKSKMANIDGIDYGLWLTVSNFSTSNNSKTGYYDGLGMKVFVHNRTLQPSWYAPNAPI